MTALERIRLDRGLSREKLSADSTIAVSTIYAIERRGARPRKATAIVLAMILEVDPGELFHA